MPNQHPNRSRAQLVSALTLAVIYTLGLYKASENRRDEQALATWHGQLLGLDAESNAERTRLVSWIRSMSGEGNAKRQVETELNGGMALDIADGVPFKWTDPRYGIPVELTFHENRLVSSSIRGPRLAQVYPTPPTTYRTGIAESVRRSLQNYLPWVWAVLFMVAVASSRWGLIPAMASLGVSLSYGCALLVSPWYSITVLGIRSNDLLCIALLMYLLSLIVVAYRTWKDGSKPKFRFGLRTALVAMILFAVCMAARSYGYVALAVSVPGLLAYLVVTYSFNGSARTVQHRSQTTAT